VSAPRVDIDLAKIEHNTQALVDLLSPVGIKVVGITKAALGHPEIGAAMLRGGAAGLGDSRLSNLARLAGLAGSTARTLIRSPMLSEARDVVRTATSSLNTEAAVLERLNEAADQGRRIHDVALMVELGDLREGIAAGDVAEAARVVLGYPALRLVGLGANLACQSGVVPTTENMDVLTRLVTDIESAHGISLDRVSGGNSASLEWALTTSDVGRTNELRLGEAILLGLDPLNRTPIKGLHLDAFTLSAEVIEVATKPAQPWGAQAQTAFGDPPPRTGSGTVRQAILAVGRQDVDHDGLQPPDGMTILGASSDHLVLAVGDHGVRVGDELEFGLGYGALVRAMTSPFVTQQTVAVAGQTAAPGR
jgi:ornithine racemase